jgi:sugar phosphate isomerase/epimerase
MELALSTRWNAYRSKSGEEMIDEILSVGFKRVELGYDLRLDHVPGVRARLADESVVVGSVHNYCPVPMGVPRGHPELFSLAALTEDERERAVRHTSRTIEFAGEMGASVVVAHAGNVRMRGATRKLIAMLEAGKGDKPKFERIRMKLMMKREQAVGKHLEALRRTCDDLLPLLERTGITLAFENLPSWEAIPTEVEAKEMLDQYASPHLGYWHDTGHGGIRENLRFVNQRHWFEMLAPHLAGMHLHDVAYPGHDHIMPPHGSLDFSSFAGAIHPGLQLVVEPFPGTPVVDLQAGHRLLRQQLLGDATGDAA